MLLTNYGVICDVDPYGVRNDVNVSELKQINNIKQVQYVFNRRTLVLKNDGTVWAWGKNYAGQNGDGTLIDREYPVKVLNLENVKKISANFSFNLAIKDDGTVWFWGFTGKEGEKKTYQNLPIIINGLKNVIQIYAMPESMIKTHDGSYWLINITKEEKFIPYKVFMD